MRAVLKGAADAGADVKEIYLNGLTYKGCQGCFPCSAKGCCIVKDELTPVLEELRKADGWVLASPIYYDSISGQMKTFFDRCRTFTRDPVLHELKPQLQGKRKGVVLVVYEDDPREDYRHEAEKLAKYLAWMGDFGDVEIMSEGNLFAADSAAGRQDLLARAEQLGRNTFGPG